MMTTNHKTPEQIDQEYNIILLAQSNPQHFEPLYNKYFEPIFRFVYQRVETKYDASDITSQIFLKALVNIKQYQHRNVPFSAWLYRIAISEIGNFYTQSERNRVVNAQTIQLNELLDEINPDYKEEQIERIINALKKLAGDDLLLIEMRFFENRAFKEMGEILKITENNAKVKFYRAIDKLKHLLS